MYSITNKDTAHIDQQGVMNAIEQLLTLNGWVAALCPTLSRPFGQSENAYDELIHSNHLYFVGMAIHSADHFLVDQLAVIVQMARRLGTQNIFVSMLDYDSSDSTETLLDLCEAVLTLLGVPFRIRRVPGMTSDPAAAYYPLEEAHMRNLALEPLFELYKIRKIKFHRVIWLKGFTCPNDIFETITVSQANDAAMVCGMDWAEHNGFFIFSDRCILLSYSNDRYLMICNGFVGGVLVTLMVINSGSQGLHLLRLRVRRAMPLVQPAMPNTFLSKFSVANLEHTSSTLHKLITKVSGIEVGLDSPIYPLRMLHLAESQMHLVSTAVKHISVEIYG